MSFYSNSLTLNLQERIAYFKNAGLNKEAELLQARLNSIENRAVEASAQVVSQNSFQSSVAERVRKDLKTKLCAENRLVPELEKQYILDGVSKAKTLKELEHLRRAIIDRSLKTSRVSRLAKSENFQNRQNDILEAGAGPYNNEKTFCDAMQLIYSQDPLWIEDLKELYFSIMPLSSEAAASKLPL